MASFLLAQKKHTLRLGTYLVRLVLIPPPMRGLGLVAVDLSLVVTVYELPLKRYIVWLDIARWFHIIRFGFTGSGRRSLPIKEFYLFRNNFVTSAGFTVLAFPGAQPQSTFNIDQSSLGQELVALFGEFSPGYHGEPLSILFPFAFRRGVPPIGGDTK
jgi:hypothetical protein